MKEIILELIGLVKFIVDKGIAKLISARFLLVIFFGATLCASVIIIMSKLFMLPSAYDTLKEPIMFLLGAFSSTVATIVSNYFNKSDRETVKGETR